MNLTTSGEKNGARTFVEMRVRVSRYSEAAGKEAHQVVGPTMSRMVSCFAPTSTACLIAATSPSLPI
ncbi:MAG: hypothetical protein Q8S42_01845 [Archangium sp.]|nr:hypothetical protein [Archangium sp.]